MLNRSAGLTSPANQRRRVAPPFCRKVTRPSFESRGETLLLAVEDHYYGRGGHLQREKVEDLLVLGPQRDLYYFQV